MPKNDKIKSLLVFVLVFGLSIPFTVKSQEIDNQLINPVDDLLNIVIATTTASTTTTVTIATTTSDMISDNETSTTTVEVVNETSSTEQVEVTEPVETGNIELELTEPEPETVELVAEPIIEIESEVVPVSGNILPTRNFVRNISVDENAPHRCAVEDFKIDVSGKNESYGKIIFTGTEKYHQYNLEIGGLAKGIDMQFTENRGYFYELEKNDEYIDFKITNYPGSRVGNFSVPIIFTKIGKVESSVICQVNILNI